MNFGTAPPTAPAYRPAISSPHIATRSVGTSSAWCTPAEADDLTQDVFLQVHRKLSSVRDPDAVVSWLYRIATHLCSDRFRRSSREPRTDRLDVSGSVQASPE